MAPAAAPTTAGGMPGPPGTFVAPARRLLGTEVLSTDARHGQEPFVSAVPRFGAPPLPSLLGDASIRMPPQLAAVPARPPGLHGPPGLQAPAPTPSAKPYEPGSLFVKNANMPGMPWNLQPNAGLKLPTPARSAAPLLVSGVRAAQGPTADAAPAAPCSRPPSARDAPAPRTDSTSTESAAADVPDAAGACPTPLPTRGSNGHGLGLCKPCAFVFKGGCNSGADCKFCHLCPPDEKKIRKKNWKDQRRGMSSTMAVADPTMVVDPAVFAGPAARG